MLRGRGPHLLRPVLQRSVYFTEWGVYLQGRRSFHPQSRYLSKALRLENIKPASMHDKLPLQKKRYLLYHRHSQIFMCCANLFHIVKFDIFINIWRSYRQMDFKIRFPQQFCSVYIFLKVYARTKIKNAFDVQSKMLGFKVCFWTCMLVGWT